MLFSYVNPFQIVSLFVVVFFTSLQYLCVLKFQVRVWPSVQVSDLRSEY